MRRAPLVIAGTAAGIAGVLAFPVHHPVVAVSGLNAPDAAGSGGTAAALASAGTAPSPTGSPTSPATAAAPGSVSAPSSSSVAAAATRSATGEMESYQFGRLAIKVTVDGDKITAASVATLNVYDNRSASIDQYAVPQLEQQVVAADSANISGVSGATFTTQAFEESVASALRKLGIG